MVLFLGSIAAVSLLVGGVGVANTMFTSVLEKTREIGIMKAIGARNSDILLIFLINSGLLGLVGGVLGIIFGVLVSLILPILGLGSGSGSAGFTFTPSISLELLVFGVLFSIAIGMISGAVPAYNASKLRPVEALRYE
jgi:putative ABC transport system permease protein